MAGGWSVARSPRPTRPPTARPAKRLDAQFVQEVGQQLRERLGSLPAPYGLWQGRAVKVLDGSSVSLTDTPDNQAAYPQPSGQRAGCGFR